MYYNKNMVLRQMCRLSCLYTRYVCMSLLYMRKHIWIQNKSRHHVLMNSFATFPWESLCDISRENSAYRYLTASLWCLRAFNHHGRENQLKTQLKIVFTNQFCFLNCYGSNDWDLFFWVFKQSGDDELSIVSGIFWLFEECTCMLFTFENGVLLMR